MNGCQCLTVSSSWFWIKSLPCQAQRHQLGRGWAKWMRSRTWRDPGVSHKAPTHRFSRNSSQEAPPQPPATSFILVCVPDYGLLWLWSTFHNFWWCLSCLALIRSQQHKAILREWIPLSIASSLQQPHPPLPTVPKTLSMTVSSSPPCPVSWDLLCIFIQSFAFWGQIQQKDSTVPGGTAQHRSCGEWRPGLSAGHKWHIPSKMGSTTSTPQSSGACHGTDINDRTR